MIFRYNEDFFEDFFNVVEKIFKNVLIWLGRFSEVYMLFINYFYWFYKVIILRIFFVLIKGGYIVLIFGILICFCKLVFNYLVMW